MIRTRLFSLLFCCFLPSSAFCTNFYVDPAWTGAHSGTTSQPWATLGSAEWTAINSALASDSVTIFFPALKADGVTQQSVARFIQCRRTDSGPNRLILDGYSFYNASETSPNWRPNPDVDINHAYLNGKVFKISNGSSSMGLGWVRQDGNDFVTVGGSVYCCIESHVASADTQPGVGANWRLYWDQHTPNPNVPPSNGSPSPPWSSGTTYRCFPKQNNVTVRGFELTGSAARVDLTGDNLIAEYLYQHDVTGIGPGMLIDYTSHPDGAAAQIIARPSTNLIFRHFKVSHSYGEGFYIGSINPDAPAAFQAAHGNQHSHILIQDFLIEYPGTCPVGTSLAAGTCPNSSTNYPGYQGQGDGIDVKDGVTYLTIQDGEISHSPSNGWNVPLSAINTDQHLLMQRVNIHDGIFIAGNGGNRAIYAGTGGATQTTMYGIVGLTIRNCIIAKHNFGISVGGGGTQPVNRALIYNNTLYGCPQGNLYVGGGAGANDEVKNNFSFGGTSADFIAASGTVSDYNVHGGPWTSNGTGNEAHSITLTTSAANTAVVNAVGKDFHLVAGSPLLGKALTISSFADDFSGRTRSTPWDIGAYQFTVASSTPTPSPTGTPTPTSPPTPTPPISPTPSPSPTSSPTPSPIVTPSNQTPKANAGPDKTIRMPHSVMLYGTATDDGLPNPPAKATYSWSKVSGPGTVTFGTPNALTTKASFSSPGVYVLTFTVSDGQLSATDTVTVTANKRH